LGQIPLESKHALIELFRSHNDNEIFAKAFYCVIASTISKANARAEIQMIHQSGLVDEVIQSYCRLASAGVCVGSLHIRGLLLDCPSDLLLKYSNALVQSALWHANMLQSGKCKKFYSEVMLVVLVSLAHTITQSHSVSLNHSIAIIIK